MAKSIIALWFISNWKIILSVAVILPLIYMTIRFNDSFDSDPEISPQESLRSKAFVFVWFVGLTISISLLISYLI